MAATTSSCTTEVAYGKHVFHVYQYNLLKTLGVGRFVRSGDFTVGGFRWAIRLYPSGKASPQQASVSLGLLSGPAAPPDAAEARVVFSLSLVDQTSGRRRSLLPDGRASQFQVFHVTITSNPLGQYAGVRPLGYSGTGAGAMLVNEAAMDNTAAMDIDKKVLESPAYLQDDHLVITCDITVIKDPRVWETQNLPYIEPPPPALSKNLGELFDAGKGADVAFDVGGEVFAAHSQVLVAWSPVFEAELLGPTKEKESRRVAVEDMQPAVFRAMLGFLYTDALPAMEDLDDDDKTEMYRHLLVAADRYAVDRLKHLCVSVLCNSLDARTVKTTLALAEQHHCDELKRACMEFLAVSAPPGGYKRRKTS